MIQKKSFLTKERLIFAVVCVVLDLFIIVVANRFLAYPGLSPAMQSIISRSWMMMMFFAMVCAGVGVALSKTYDMARAYFLESVILIVCGFWFGVSRDAICVSLPTADQTRLFLTAHVFLTIAMMIFQADIIFSHPLEALYLGKVSPGRPDVSALSVRQKRALAQTLMADIQNSRGNDGYFVRSSQNAPGASPAMENNGVEKPVSPSLVRDIEDKLEDGALMHRQNARYAVKTDFDAEDDAVFDLPRRPKAPGPEGVKTPLHSKSGHPAAPAVESKPKAPPLKPVPAQVDKNAYKKTAQPSDKTEWDPVKVARESAARREERGPANLAEANRSRTGNTAGEKPSPSPAPQSSQPVKTAEDEPKPKPASSAEPPKTKEPEPEKDKSAKNETKKASGQAAASQPVKAHRDLKTADRPTPETPSADPAEASNNDERHDAQKQPATDSSRDETAEKQKQHDDAFEHIDIAWADPKPAKRRR